MGPMDHPRPLKEVVKIFKALSDPARLRIMLLLWRRELCVCELMFILGMEQSRISHHMRILREAGIAEGFRERQWIIYRIPERAHILLGSFFAGALLEQTEHSREASADIKKLDRCIRENMRARVCGIQSRKDGR